MSRLIARHPVLGDLVLDSYPVEPVPVGQRFRFYARRGGSFGVGDPVVQAIDELIGSLAEVSRWQNREVDFVVTCEAADGEGLAEGEAALGAYLAGRFELVWEPIAAFAEPVSFWIEPGARWPRTDGPSDLTWAQWEGFNTGQEDRPRRSWALTLTARPFVVAAAPTVTEWALSGAEGKNTVTVGGVAPASAGLTIAGTAGLGKVVAHVASTTKSYSPALRQFMTSSTTATARPGVPAFAGGTWYGHSGATFAVPAATLPDGPYELLAHVESLIPQKIALSWTAQTKIGSISVGPAWTGTSDPIDFAIGHAQLVPMGKLALPIICSDDPAATLQITFGTAGGLVLDEGFLAWVPDDNAALITGDLGAGTAAVGSAWSRLEVQAPTVVEPRQRLRVGTGATATVGGSYFAGADRLIVKPGPVQVFVATAGATAADVTLSVREAFHDHTIGAAA